MPLSHESHIDPHSLPFEPLPKGSPICSVELLHMGWIHSHRGMWADDAWDPDHRRREAKKETPYSLPLFGALVHHGSDRYLWDLGWRNDEENVPELFKTISFGRTELPSHAQAYNLVDPSSLSGLIWSHAHVDHYGATDRFPVSLPVFTGQGTLEWINGGDKRGGLKGFPTAYLEQGREFIEVGQDDDDDDEGGRWKKQAVGPFEEAYDLFGDQSAFLVKAAGHCPGHLALLVHVSSSDWVFLAADAGHNQSLYLPIPPKPFSSQTDRRSVPAEFKYSPKDENWSCMQDFPQLFWRTAAAMTRLEMEENVMVILGHENEFATIANLTPGSRCDLGQWREKEYKRKKDEEGERVRRELNKL